MKRVIASILLVIASVHSITEESLRTVLQQSAVLSSFNYDLALKVLGAPQSDADIMICCHGYGGNHRVAQRLGLYKIIPDHIIGFNFPDHDMRPYMDHANVSFGTIHELLPLIALLKTCVVSGGIQKINLYGFSAGGAAVINTLAILMTNRYEKELQGFGVTNLEKQKILNAIQAGLVILDCPLKSLEEVIAQEGPLPALLMVAKKYEENNLRPIDSLESLRGLALNIVLHFQEPDEILSNRDDALFIQLVQNSNDGKTTVVIGANEGGHNGYHPSLWKAYAELLNLQLDF